MTAVRGFGSAVSRTSEKQAADHEHDSGGEKREIPAQAFVAHMVNAEDLMVDDSFDEVESAPADD